MRPLTKRETGKGWKREASTSLLLNEPPLSFLKSHKNKGHQKKREKGRDTLMEKLEKRDRIPQPCPMRITAMRITGVSISYWADLVAGR